MRNSFIHKLIELAEKDEKIVLLTGDLGFSVLEPFAEKFPKRFYNVGVSEQNMVAIATGLAEAGFIPFTYSIATFSVLRPFEFIRNGPLLHKLPVRVVAIGAGYEYGSLGTTHHLIEDIALMRSQHGMEIVIPVDGDQAKNALEATYKMNKPVYYRLGKDEKIKVPELSGKFDKNEFRSISYGNDVLMVSLGPVSTEAVKALENMKKSGINGTVLFIDFISDNTHAKLLEFIGNKFSKIITIEDHSINGGIGSIVAEVISENSIRAKLKRLGCNRPEDGVFGERLFMYQKFGFDAEGILRTYKSM